METEIPFRKLPESFTKHQYRFTKVFRDGDVAVYSQAMIHDRKNVPVGFEVIITKVGKPHPKDKDQSLKEIYPSAEQWGAKGWTFTDYQTAIAKAEGLVQQEALASLS